MIPTYADSNTTRLDLGDNRWIEIKNELSRGDRIKQRALGMTRDPKTGDYYADMERIPNAKPLVYIVAWWLTDAKGEAVPVTHEALNALSEELGTQIDNAIKTHEATHAKKSQPPAGAKQ